MAGKLYIVGVGPGDPRLLTLRAHDIIKAAGTIAYFCRKGRKGQALSIVEGFLGKETKMLPLVYPYTTEISSESDTYRQEMRAFYDRSAQLIEKYLKHGESIALICEGDPLLYGSAMYILERLKPHYQMEIIPGIMSMNGSWCRVQKPMVWGQDNLLVCSAVTPKERMTRLITRGDGIVIMKVGSNFDKVKQVLEETGRFEEAVYVAYGTQKEERICPLGEVKGKVPYFSLILLPGCKHQRL